MTDGDANAEGFYVAVRILEEVAKEDGDTEGAAVCARVAERVRDTGLSGVEGILDGAEGRSAERIRVALAEVREGGTAEIAGEVDDDLVAVVRSEFDA
jgi:hypothetical protein